MFTPAADGARIPAAELKKMVNCFFHVEPNYIDSMGTTDGCTLSILMSQPGEGGTDNREEYASEAALLTFFNSKAIPDIHASTGYDRNKRSWLQIEGNALPELKNDNLVSIDDEAVMQKLLGLVNKKDDSLKLSLPATRVALPELPKDESLCCVM